ncbi:MAG TPA: hypothetical protein VGF84_16425 [Micromonosporaceae bacterium]|jgi:hypothetical protein
MANRPTLLNSCAYAATAAEARYRIDAKPQQARASCVVALDAGATGVVAVLRDEPWLGARFLTYDAHRPRQRDGGDHALTDVVLGTGDGGQVRLSEQLDDTDFMMMIATANDGAAAATAIGNACTLRGIMTAGVILGDAASTGAAVSALRPHARVLLVTNDRGDVADLMSAVGA